MKNIFITLLFLGLLIESSYCQDSLNYKSKWQIRPNYGINIPITKLLNGSILDNLFEYGDNSTYWQVLSISYFFRRHWGVEFNFQGMTSGNIAKRADKFMDAMKSEYKSDYYVTPSTGASYDNFSLLAVNFNRGFIGLIYRYEKNRLFFYPKFSIGITSFYTDWGKATLKRKNSNNVIEVSYDPSNIPNGHFVVATSAAFGYKLTKKIYLNMDLMASYYKTDITFTKKITDLNTAISRSEKMEYIKNVFTVSIGAGLIFLLKTY